MFDVGCANLERKSALAILSHHPIHQRFADTFSHALSRLQTQTTEYTMPQSRPFPLVTGGCFCRAVRYRLMAAPLFCYACHCADCHKHTGSVFACFTSIEAEFLSSVGSVPAEIITRVRPSGKVVRLASCPKCGTTLWASGDNNPVTVDIRTGTLDTPQLFEPDIHAFIESKIPWIDLPKGAKTCTGYFDFRKTWPAASLKRFDVALLRYEEKRKSKKAGVDGVLSTEDEKEADKTPTAQSPEETEEDEEFEQKYQEAEKALQERLEKLTLKLNEATNKPVTR
jgi:hypothetical protein